jgi:hypothetical protein
MRSTNLILFLILLNASAGIVAATGPTNLSPSAGGSDVIVRAEGEIVERETDQPSSEEIIGSFFGLGKLLQSIDQVLFAGPNMLQRLGMPAILVTGFKTAVIFIAGFDVAEAVTGRKLS